MSEIFFRSVFKSSIVPLLLVAIISFTVPTSAISPSGFVGEWKLNREQSDDPREKMKEAMGGGFPGGMRPPGGGPMGEMNSNALTITVADPEFSVNGRTIYTDGRTVERDGPRGGKVQQTAGWQGDRLVSVTVMGGSDKITETWELSADGRQVITITEMSLSFFKNPVTIRRVFDAAKK